MTDFATLKNRQWNQFCDFGMSDPVPLASADLTRSFVYERRFGVFYVPSGMHTSVMSFLLALQMGCDHGIDAAEKLGVAYSGGTAEYWMEHTPGGAMRSSVGKRIHVGDAQSLIDEECSRFGDYLSIK